MWQENRFNRIFYTLRSRRHAHHVRYQRVLLLAAFLYEMFSRMDWNRTLLTASCVTSAACVVRILNSYNTQRIVPLLQYCPCWHLNRGFCVLKVLGRIFIINIIQMLCTYATERLGVFSPWAAVINDRLLLLEGSPIEKTTSTLLGRYCTRNV